MELSKKSELAVGSVSYVIRTELTRDASPSIQTRVLGVDGAVVFQTSQDVSSLRPLFQNTQQVFTRLERQHQDVVKKLQDGHSPANSDHGARGFESLAGDETSEAPSFETDPGFDTDPAFETEASSFEPETAEPDAPAFDPDAAAFEPDTLLFITLNREDFSFVIHLDRQPRTSRRRRRRQGRVAARERAPLTPSSTPVPSPFLIFHRGGLRIKVTRRLSNQTRRPSSRMRRPSSTTRRPSSKSHRLSSQTRRLSSTKRRLSSTKRRLSSTKRRLSSTCCRPLSPPNPLPHRRGLEETCRDRTPKHERSRSA